MIAYIKSLFSAATPIQLVLAVVALIVAVVIVIINRKTLRLTDGKDKIDTLFGLVAGGILGALTGVLWATFNPIQLAPGIHLRLFAFLPCVFGILLGRGVGFISGYVATLVWATMSGLFVPFHTPLADAVFVGLTGWIPGWLLRGKLSFEGLLANIEANKKQWYIKSGLVCLFAGLFMSIFVAISLQATIQLPFMTGFVLIGLASDTPPMILGTGILSYLLLKATKRSWSWLRAF